MEDAAVAALRQLVSKWREKAELASRSSFFGYDSSQSADMAERDAYERAADDLEEVLNKGS